MTLLHRKSYNIKNRRRADISGGAVKRCIMSFLSAVCAGLLLCAFVFTAAAQDCSETRQVEELVPVTKSVGDEKDAQRLYSYNQNTAVADPSRRGIVIPVTVNEPGSIKISFSSISLDRAMSVYMYMDCECTNRLADNLYITTDSMGEEIHFSAETAGTYYLSCSSYAGYSRDSKFINEFKIGAALYPSGIKQAPDGIRVTYYRTSPDEKHLFEFKAAKTGVVRVYLPYQNGSYVKMLNASKKAISQTEYVSANSDYSFRQEFYVKKGNTYYLEVTSNGISEHLQSIKVSYRSVKARGGAKRSSASLIRTRKKAMGMLVNGGKRTVWYKAKIPVGKKLRLTVKGKINGGLTVSVYDKNGKNVTKGKKASVSRRAVVKTKRAMDKKSVYYIKVEKANRYSSGEFTLRVRAA